MKYEQSKVEWAEARRKTRRKARQTEKKQRQKIAKGKSVINAEYTKRDFLRFIAQNDLDPGDITFFCDHECGGHGRDCKKCRIKKAEPTITDF